MNVRAGVLALIAAVLFAFTSVLQHRGAAAADRGRVGDPRLVARLLRRPLWLLGGVTDAAGVVTQGAALKAGALAFVQPLLVSGLLLSIPLEAWLRRQRPDPGLVAAVAVAGGGLAGFLAVTRPGTGVPRPSDRAWVIVALCVAAGALACLLAARATERLTGIWLGLAAGVLYGLTAALLKTAAQHVPADLAGLLRDWTAYAFVVVGLIGFTLNQNAFQVGSLAGALTALTLAEPVVGLIVGATAFHEHLDVGGPLRELVVVASVVAMAAGVWQVCIRQPATSAPPSVPSR
jgi:drug/metabolite transporter (DMT)-like permease